MIDSMCTYLLEEESFLSSQMPDVPLPCAEVLWDASSAKQWREVVEFADGESTLAISNYMAEPKSSDTINKNCRSKDLCPSRGPVYSWRV
jgi:hypothetical protein